MRFSIEKKITWKINVYALKQACQYIIVDLTWDHRLLNMSNCISIFPIWCWNKYLTCDRQFKNQQNYYLEAYAYKKYRPSYTDFFFGNFHFHLQANEIKWDQMSFILFEIEYQD